jgi:hypothetical protein
MKTMMTMVLMMLVMVAFNGPEAAEQTASTGAGQCSCEASWVFGGCFTEGPCPCTCSCRFYGGCRCVCSGVVLVNPVND